MKNFYGNVISTSAEYSDALRNAKLGLMRSEKYSAPFYWAPFVLIGF
jgi:CHAT domain-containing protein